MPAVYPGIIEAWNDPQMRHAMLIHFPVVLSAVALVFAVIAAVGKGPERAMRWTALAMYAALLLFTYMARESGEDAKEAIEGSVDEEAEEELEAHEDHGEDLWMWPLGIGILLGLSFVERRAVRLPAAWLAVGAGLLAADQIAHTADHGGRLVYTHGVAGPAGPDLGAILAAAAAEPAEDPRVAFFRSNVRPVLVHNCLRCHNPQRQKRSGGLNQTSIAGLLEGGYSGPAIVPGRPEESLLIEAVRWTDEDLQMPPGDEQLPAEAIAALEQWVADGAVWETFEYTPPARD